ncbi:hypothetical protein GCM10023238_23130 [Streptomyces heliomycini]
MPPKRHATRWDGTRRRRDCPSPNGCCAAFLDASRRHPPRVAAHLVTGAAAFAAPEPQRLPGLRAWAADVAAGHDAGVRLSLRIEARGLTNSADTADVSFRAVLQMHGVNDPALVADAGEVWAGAFDAAFAPVRGWTPARAPPCGPRAWAPLAPLLSATVAGRGGPGGGGDRRTPR